MNAEQKARLVRIIQNGCEAGGHHFMEREDGHECRCIVADMVKDCPPVKVDNLTAICHAHNTGVIYDIEMHLVREVLSREFGLDVIQLTDLQTANDEIAGCDEDKVERRRQHVLEKLDEFKLTDQP